MSGTRLLSACCVFPRTEPESPRPEVRSTAAEGLGREGMVTVWDDEGRYLGCMGIELWRLLLAQSAKPS